MDDLNAVPIKIPDWSGLVAERDRLAAELSAARARMHRALDVARAETREAHARRRLVERERDTARARVTEMDKAPGGAALDSAVDALLYQADASSDPDLIAVAEWLRRIAALDDD